MSVPLSWERLLWSGRPSLVAAPRAAGERYALTDFRLVRFGRQDQDELPIQDIGEVACTQSAIERLLDVSTITVHPRRRTRPAPRPPLVLHGVRDGVHLAALLELLAGDPQARVEPEAVAAALRWRPQQSAGGWREATAAVAVVAVAIASVVIGLHGTARPVAYAPDDPIYPNGVKRDREAIAEFMKADVMPWAREALGPIVARGDADGASRVRCETCHGRDAQARAWRMPGVAALPQPGVKARGWELWSAAMDAQMRNAIYGYGADADKQRKAAYMHEVVMPGMARLLHRPAYDFAKTYEGNRDRNAFGCYHCHKVK